MGRDMRKVRSNQQNEGVYWATDIRETFVVSLQCTHGVVGQVTVFWVNF
jgi:hypothetical protein